jgi:starvation-inducible DNA-binding protein
MEANTQLSEKLNTLLATYQIHYQNIRALHWNIKGSNFFELHLKYEEFYNRTQIIIDEIAELILTQGSTPLHSFKDYIKNSILPENDTIHDGKTGMTYLLKGQKAILILEKELLDLSNELDEEVVNGMMSDLIREKEKTNWMLGAWLGH